MNDAAPITGCSLLVEWANQQDNWVRPLVTEVLGTRKPVTEREAKLAYEMLLCEKELAEGTVLTIPPLRTATEARNEEEALSLETLDNVQNVNALATGQSIVFNERMNVFFGENGAGKTGYVRVLKAMAAVRTAEPILPDIEKNTPPGKPSAVVCCKVGTTKLPPITWNGESGLPPLTRIDVFDSRGVLIHVDQELTYTYTPSDVSLFRLVHEALEQVRQRLEQARQEKLSKGNPFIAGFTRDTAVYPKIESLGPSTDLNEIKRLATISPEEEAGLDPLRERVEALRSTSTNARLQVAASEADLIRVLLPAIAAIETFRVAEYRSQLATTAEAERLYKHATEEAFAGDTVPGVLSDAWRAFIEAGEKYVESLGDLTYPAEGEVCLYCRQPLGDTAVTLIKQYRDYCNNVLRKAAVESRATLDSLTAGLRKLELARLSGDVQKKLVTFQGEHAVPPAFQSVSVVLDRAIKLQNTVMASTDSDDAGLATAAAETRTHLQTRLEEAQSITAQLTQESIIRKKTLETEAAKLKNLEARIILRELLPAITMHIEDAKWADKAGTIVGRISRTVSKTLTDASKIASEQLVNQDFEKHFFTECTALKAPKVTLDFPGRKGQPARRKVLGTSHKLSDVLSEGELKVIALADFLAESSLRRRATPVVFDDPVTSLDYRRLQYVVNRTVEISRTRQVIVFTHNIWFTMELLSRFEEEKTACAYYDVSACDGQSGLLSKGNHPRVDTFSTMKARLNVILQDATAAQAAETKDALVEKGYEILRGVCEVIVETDLLQGVTQRYQPNVMMTKLQKIKANQLPAAVAVITPIFEKACRYIASHSQPLETLNVRPSLDEFKKDWADVQAAREAYLKN